MLESLRQKLDEMTLRVKAGDETDQGPHFPPQYSSKDKLASLFEPSTGVIRKGKARKPNEFGKLVKLQTAESLVITHYEVYARRPNDSDSDLPVVSIEGHLALLECPPRLVVADAAFCSARKAVAARAKGVKRVCIPNRATKSSERKHEERKCWFRTPKSGAPDARDASA